MSGSAHQKDSNRSQLDASVDASDDDSSPQTNRRGAIRLAAGGVALALIAPGMRSSAVLAQQATPAPAVSKEGLYTVIRSRVVKADRSIDELNTAIRDGLVPLIAAIPGFVEYYVVQNPDTRERTAVSMFLDKAAADESTTMANDFINGQGLSRLLRER